MPCDENCVVAVLALKPSGSVADPHHFDADPDPTFHSAADPDPTTLFFQIWTLQCFKMTL